MKTAKFRRLQQLLLMVLLLLGVFAFAGSVRAEEEGSDADPVFTMEPVQVELGQTFSVPIKFATEEPVRSVKFDVVFNPAIVRLESLQEGTFLSDYAVPRGGSTVVVPAVIDNVNGTANGFRVSISGLPAGQGAPDNGIIAVLNFTALSNGRFYIALRNIQVQAAAGYSLLNINVTGGLVQVGPPPHVTITNLRAVPSGEGIANYGYEFKLHFDINNINGSISDPTQAIVSVFGATPSLLWVNIPPLQIGEVRHYVLEGYRLVEGSDSADISVFVIGDGSAHITYRYLPVMDSGMTQVDAEVGAFLDLTAPERVEFRNMQLGVNNVSATLNVRCNTAYRVDVFDPESLTNWHMRQWDGATYKGYRLGTPLEVRYAPQGSLVTKGTPAHLLSGDISGQGANNAGQNFDLLFTQTLQYGDALLPSGEVYHLVLIFNGYVTL